MSLSVQSSNPIASWFGSSSTAPAAASTTTTSTTAMPQDSVQLSEAANPPMEAGFFKKFGDSVGQMFSNMAYSMHMGETYNLVEREFRQVDLSGDGTLNHGEFTVATLNPFEFQNADRNYDGRVTLPEYAKYRKERLEVAFKQKDANADRFLNVAEIGAVGRYYLANRDPRVDTNMDGLMSKREYVKAQLTLGISIRDLLGF
ncbi:hypothetical protein COW36_12050 [bacterium (Candidatus Blackallbacteria) CG17_big_fil_post_rev_8_21_14_2_50_48_46]|uniref:EF-hand domain-containing protein n=1 Tax=bacterium (Candidatus Blackallbacteria) CG17_big_fil_post_rev_8_21_14_2_50_48_46 TaxID=2014261 RepID=A0A2M7G3P3_9BACT|nr:MAG: hypothetical protein COW64_03210 [bacterium (Candidatus Blackallbacteria) CG18_big_fil_WC_8_21_14_2_50_49_26]PIW16492.1 MAG: hypothetical protein COW36_12050 [bacterium (Candidatus Blackallbacteria) CG17_big_fil_post_rev_8_21_14_2_50_48_46]PIW46000.1 MAG: hypothetical protein COW20_17315 [bacterium (Candidatus Blackallbacteria) CG13_big_fil_rev_8_21_14_2_50_49_14]